MLGMLGMLGFLRPERVGQGQMGTVPQPLPWEHQRAAVLTSPCASPCASQLGS